MLEAVSPTGLFGVAGAVKATQVLEAMMGCERGYTVSADFNHKTAL